MRPLTHDDLLPLEEYATRRREFFESLQRYLDRYRRVRVGPRVSLLFENRQTLWFRVQELLRIARLSDPAAVQAELDLYNHLLPGRDQLQATLLIDVAEESRLTAELADWRSLRGEDLTLSASDKSFPALLVTCRPEDAAIGATHWVQFQIPRVQRSILEDPRVPARVAIARERYEHQSDPLSDDIRQSLLEDLVLSDRD